MTLVCPHRHLIITTSVYQNSGNIGYGHNTIINYYVIVTNDFIILVSQTKALISANFEMISMYCGGNRILYWYSN